MDLEVAPTRQRPVDDRLLEHDRARPARRERLGDDVPAGEPGGAGGRGDGPGEHADGGGLAGAVGPQEAEDLAGEDVEVDATHGLHIARVRLGQPPYFDCKWFHFHLR